MKQAFTMVVVLPLLAATFACQYNSAANVSKQSPPAAAEQLSVRDQSQPLNLPLTDPRIVVLKARRQLELYSADKLVRTYKIGLGLNPVPDKEREGDRATPEGDFYVFTKNPRSAFHLSLVISYPNSKTPREG